MERWKPVVGFETCYAVSDQGRVARIATYGKVPSAIHKICAPRIKSDGYVSYHLSFLGKARDAPAHRLVWAAFEGPIPDHLEINHKNSKRSDNRLENLELLTRSQNAAYAFSHNGRKPANNPQRGSRNGSAKLSEADIPEIIRLYDSGLMAWEIAQKYGVTNTCISTIIRGETWRHVERRPIPPRN